MLFIHLYLYIENEFHFVNYDTRYIYSRNTQEEKFMKIQVYFICIFIDTNHYHIYTLTIIIIAK
jgi:hypothetical protein